MRYVPGLIGALAAFVVVKLMAWSGVTLQLITFVGGYLLVTMAADRALLGYGRSTGRGS
jgi:hypothetical protein